MVRPYVEAKGSIGLQSVNPDPFLSFPLSGGPGLLAIKDCDREVLKAVLEEMGHQGGFCVFMVSDVVSMLGQPRS